MTVIFKNIFRLTLMGVAIVACAIKSTQDILGPLTGTYFYAHDSGDEISVVENCSIQTGDQFRIEKMNGIFMLYHVSHETVGYVVQKANQNGQEILVEAFDEDVDGETENPPIRKFKFFLDDYLTMTKDDTQFLLVLVADTNKYIFHSCQEAMELEPDSDAPVAIPEFDATKEGQIKAELFKLLDPNADHPIYFSEGQTVTLASPGPGVEPYVQSLKNDKDLKAFVNGRFGKYSPGFLAAWYSNGLFNLSELPFKCEPTRAGIFISITTDPASQVTTAEISLVDDEGGEPETVFTLFYQWDENSALILSKIDITDCSA
jgi:hypothetical protein